MTGFQVFKRQPGPLHANLNRRLSETMPDNWDQLLEQVRQALTSTSDQELQGVMLRFYHEHSEVERPSHTEVIRLGARLLHFATGRLNARAAIMFMARASWEYTGAVKLYLETADDSDVEVEVDTARKYETSDGGSESEEGSEGSEGAKSGNLSEEMKRLNQGIDRSGAKRGERDDSKLKIELSMPGGAIKTFEFPHQPVNWSLPLKALNRWRSQIFRRYLGGGRPFRTRFHADEKNWLYNEHLQFVCKCRANMTPVDFTKMKWADLASRFNLQFAGKVLPGVADPRPSRTVPALRTERRRIPAIKNYMETMQGKIPQTIEEEIQPGKEGQEEGQNEGQDGGHEEY